jgi:hypothetical protein
MNAATKIQASFRGHMARKQAEKSKTDGEITKEMEKLQSKVVMRARTAVIIMMS